jgi:hypothetical protein
MAIDAARFADVTQHLHTLWAGMYYYFNRMHILSFLFQRSLATYYNACITLSTNAMGNNTRYCFISYNDSN